jgi:hypothetical protein
LTKSNALGDYPHETRTPRLASADGGSDVQRHVDEERKEEAEEEAVA